MKKSILIFTLIILFGSLSCSKKESNVTPAQCSSTINNEYAAAVTAYVSDPTEAKCLTVFKILGTLVNCPGVTAQAKAEYQKAINDSPCK